jgi:hypothetical protein
MNIIEEKINEIESRMKKEAREVFEWDRHVFYHNLCTDEVTIDGLWMEFGVFRGRSICNLASKTDKIVYGFDSFEGLPESWDENNPKGFFSLNGVVPDGVIDQEDIHPSDPSPSKTKSWPSNIRLIKGWFDDTLPIFVSEQTENAALIHIDSDIYSSAKTIFKFLENKIVDGTIVMFDEIINYPDYKNHEIKAFAEFLLDTELDYQPLVYQSHGYGQACFRILNKK